jgi:hypothetical protein
MNRIGSVSVIALVMVVGGAGALQGGRVAAAPTRNIDPVADKMLRQMTNYLAGLQSFKVESSAIDEVVLKSGQKLALASDSVVTVQRPNKLRSEQRGASTGMAFLYDGKTMTLACKVDNTYATAPAPATIDATIDQARKQFKIEAPGADLLYSKPYDILTEQVTGGQFIGRESIDGVAANHLAFQGEEIDWQIWIQDGPQPLPLRFSITTKTMKEQPEFSVRLSHWETGAKLSESLFQWQPPPEAKRVQAFPSSCGSSPR